ncbi:NlpC/P60 family protein [Vibrio hannami]|uniref:C40 family peptidase n=1 Tax=Vibrio hannami TaxID=2717094 RepID=UPI0024101415|nr:NlpC/P60 family protein [Vibrio hannami]MDG3088067.1 NlpC/P60 family protein [Vibrio hannami]
MNFRRSIKLALISSALLMSVVGCTSKPNMSSTPSVSDEKLGSSLSSNDKTKGLWTEYQSWKGTPYRFGGTSKSGVDCSAFVQSVFYKAQNKTLPRTTEHQLNSGYEVKYENAKAGDLVFFKTTWKDKHVGIYLGENAFMHASTSRGVIISRLDNPYWSSVFWQIRRID